MATTLTLSAKDPATVASDALVVAVASGASSPRLLGADALPAPVRSALGSALGLVGVTGAADEVRRIPAPAGVSAKSVLFTGVGAVRGSVPPETLRRAAGAAIRNLTGVARVALALPADSPESVAAIAEGALFGAYAYDRYRSSAGRNGGSGDNGSATPPSSITLVGGAASASGARTAARRARILADAVHGTRDLVNAAPVDLYPATFAEEATAAVEDLPVTVTVLDERRLARGGYGGILGVGLGSSRPPRLVHLDYSPQGAKAHVALVGKGITFDSGGLSIKPAANMDAMKSDMSGAAAVLHTVVAAARLGLPIRVGGWLALAENMPSGTAQRPSDVLTVRGGRTVEVLNTDAEGRLVLADAIVAAGETEPDIILDIATLTGAQMVALGNRTSALMGNDDDLRDRLHRIADEVGEQFWPMPLPPELRSSMDSRVADIANIGDRYGGMLVAGLFLKEFVPSRGDGTEATPVPWAHLDIAGPAFNTGAAHGYTPAGGTGVGVRLMLGLCEEIAYSPTS